jgi:hypothetical protein
LVHGDPGMWCTPIVHHLPKNAPKEIFLVKKLERKINQIDKSLSPDHPKLNKEDVNHLNRSTTRNEIEAAIVSQKRKVQDLMDPLLNSIRHLKKK